jgi:hypothetical protein
MRGDRAQHGQPLRGDLDAVSAEGVCGVEGHGGKLMDHLD